MARQDATAAPPLAVVLAWRGEVGAPNRATLRQTERRSSNIRRHFAGRSRSAASTACVHPEARLALHPSPIVTADLQRLAEVRGAAEQESVGQIGEPVR